MNNQRCYKLTTPQNNIWNTEKYFSGSSINNICGDVYIKEVVNFKLLKQSIQIVLNSYDNFKEEFINKDNVTYQSFSKNVDSVIIDTINVKSQLELSKIEKEMAQTPFSISNNILFSFKIFKYPNGFGGIILSMHHLLGDSWTLGLICKEIISNYKKLLNNDSTIDTTYSYVDFINKEDEYMNSESFQKDKNYWNDLFNSIPEVASIPALSKSGSKSNSCHAGRKLFNLSNVLVQKINDFCRASKISTYNFLMSIFSIYIGRVSNLDDFVIGTPILNRLNFAEKHTNGMFISTVPLRINIKNDVSFISFCQSIAQSSISMLRHQRYPYSNILSDLRKRDSSIPNLYSIVLSYQITKTLDDEIPCETHWVFNGNCADDLQIHIVDYNNTGSLNILYDYKKSKYTATEIANLHARIYHMIEQVINNTNIGVNDIEIVTETEKHQLLYEFNNTKVDYPKDKTIVDLFEEQVENTPDNIAVVFEDQKLTYRELNEKANQLARYLVEKGVKPGDVVGIMLYRSLEMVIGLIAILKSGAAYLPLDPTYPEERINYILKDSNCKLVLLHNKTQKLLQNLSCMSINIDLNNFSLSSLNLHTNIVNINLVYMIYTSGSTGNPKGVMVTHKNLVNFLFAEKSLIDFSRDKVMISVTTFCFDIFGLEIWGTLSSGMLLVLASDLEQNSQTLLRDLCLKYHVNMIQTTPSRYSVLTEDSSMLDFFKNFTEIMIGGETCSNKLLKNLQRITSARILNMYGPTETTVWSTFKDLTNSNVITIGKPIANTYCYILSKNKKLLPIGTPGELFIGGDGVSNGYWNRADLTKEKFISLPFSSCLKLYDTNDLAYYNDSGEIVHLGRTDFQIKLHGYRIDLDEIKNKLLELSSLKNVVITASNNKFLVCYYTSCKALLDTELSSYLLKFLPNYMIPSYFVRLSAIPLTPNGKINMHALPKVSEFVKSSKKPTTKNEILLCKKISKILHTHNIDINTSFFDLGMDSLMLIQLQAELAVIGINLTVQDFYKYFTVKNLGNFIDKLSNHSSNTLYNIVPCYSNLYPLSSAQKRIYLASKIAGNNSLIYNISGAILIDTILDNVKVENVFKKIINLQDSFRTAFIIDNGDIKQKILDNVEFSVPVFSAHEKDIKKLINSFAKPFDLSTAPLLRISLCYIDNKKTLLLIDSHHIIMDGTSMQILINEFCKLYNSENLEDLPLQYKDYSEWENNFINSNEINKYKDYWVNKFKNSDFSELNLPYDYDANNDDYSGKTFSQKIDITLSNKIYDYVKKNKISAYMFYVSAFAIMLYKYTGQNEIILGTPYANRNFSNLENIIGMFVNNLTIRFNIDSSISFSDFVLSMKEQILSDIDNGIYPYDFLVKDLNVASRNLFNIMFVYQNTKESSFDLNGLTGELIPSDLNIAKFNLSFEINPSDNQINIQYRSSLFNELTIKNFFMHYMIILNNIIDNPSILIKDIKTISNDEEKLLLNDFNNTGCEIEYNDILDLFYKSLQKNLNHPAIVFENNSMNYDELNIKSNQLANYLLLQHVSNKNSVAILLNRSFDLIVSIFACLKAGIPYVLIDPSFPLERIQYIISTSKSNLLILNSNICEADSFNIASLDISNFDYSLYKDVCKNTDFSEYISIIYTSGSTGDPKGVLLKRYSFLNLICDFDKDMHISNYQKILCIASVSFDMFAVEVFSSILFGNTLVLSNEEEQRNPIKMSDLMYGNNVEFFITTPSRIELLLNNTCKKAFTYVKAFQLGGEKFSDSLFVKIRQFTNSLIFNGYGPTEITACCSNKLVSQCPITIGKPLGNVNIYICDKFSNLCPIGIVGEICVTGFGVAVGYINSNSKAFIKNPFGFGLMYKTGDLGKYNNNGEISYIGRIDSQVKVRGQRIELSEIESKINEFDYINNSAVIYKNDTHRSFLVAFIVSNSNIDKSLLRNDLLKILPSYMIPNYIVQLDKLPITNSGKIDRKSLANYKVTTSNDTLSSSYVAPQTENQKLFCKIWSSLLNINVGITDNLFELGADSLLAIRFKTLALSNNIDVPYSIIFKYKSIEKICEHLDYDTTSLDSVYNFDYTDINNLLNGQNTRHHIYNDKNNVLLLGGNGFVGMHIIKSFLTESSGKIYCIIRERNNISAIDRFTTILHYYFSNTLDKYLSNRLFVINGNITEDNFGLSNVQYNLLRESVDVVINSAANVKHFGNYDNFSNINIGALKNSITFCLRFDKRLLHISTLSVSGNLFYSNSNLSLFSGSFTEKNLYVGQILDNVYTKSKFEAEKLILDNIVNNNLNAQIFRLGNITNRYSDGAFQYNYAQNAFANRIKCLLAIKEFPKYLIDTKLEFTPVDYCARAIIILLNNYYKNMYVYHIDNKSQISCKHFIDLLKDLNIDIKIVDDAVFEKDLENILSDDSKSDSISGIINDFDHNKHLNFSPNISIDSSLSINLLNKNNFNWPLINYDYLEKYINYFNKIGFFS